MINLVVITYSVTLYFGARAETESGIHSQSLVPSQIATIVFCVWFSVPNIGLLVTIRKDLKAVF